MLEIENTAIDSVVIALGHTEDKGALAVIKRLRIGWLNQICSLKSKGTTYRYLSLSRQLVTNNTLVKIPARLILEQQIFAPDEIDHGLIIYRIQPRDLLQRSAQFGVVRLHAVIQIKRHPPRCLRI